MKRKLLLLNLLLVALLAALGWRLRTNWLEARAREQKMIAQQLRAVPAPPITPATPPAPLEAAKYVEIAQKMLFSRDRNPTVEVIVAPPKLMPPLPVAHGVFLLGDEPAVILSENAAAPHKAYFPGQTIGEFKVVAVTNRELEFEWDGKRVTRNLQGMLEEGKKSAPAPASAPVQPATAPPPAAPAATNLGGKAGMGVDIGAGTRACTPGDTTPPGTVQDGLKKVVTASPFGSVCRWEPVK